MATIMRNPWHVLALGALAACSRGPTGSTYYEREIQPLPKLGRWKAELDRLLAANEAKPARERLTLIRVFEALRALGYEGGYDAVRRYAP